MNLYISEIVESILATIHDHGSQNSQSVYDFSHMSQKLGNIEDPNELTLREIAEEENVSPVFTAADIYPDTDKIIFNNEMKVAEAATQTSQSLYGMFADATAQTSQDMLQCADNGVTLSVPGATQASQNSLLEGSRIYRSIMGVNPNTDETVEFHDADDQIVPTFENFKYVMLETNRLKIRRVGLSKRARMNPLHPKKLE